MTVKRYTTEIGQDIYTAAGLLAYDELVAIPTETVYGLAACAYSAKAINQIFKVKNRPKHNPLIVHVPNLAEVEKVATDIPALAYSLFEQFSPGPLTVLLPRQKEIPDLVTNGMPMLAVRIPDHPLTLDLLRLVNFPLAAPSANRFTKLSPTSPQHVLSQLGGSIPYILDGGPCDKGIESTVVGIEDDKIIVYRPGAITIEQLRTVSSNVLMKKEHATVQSPGMSPHHYAPNTRLILTNDPVSVASNFDASKIGIITFNTPASFALPEHTRVLSKNGDMEEAARNLYQALHELDQLSLSVILATPLPEYGLGLAINDRLMKAAAGSGLI